MARMSFLQLWNTFAEEVLSKNRYDVAGKIILLIKACKTILLNKVKQQKEDRIVTTDAELKPGFLVATCSQSIVLVAGESRV